MKDSRLPRMLHTRMKIKLYVFGSEILSEIFTWESTATHLTSCIAHLSCRASYLSAYWYKVGVFYGALCRTPWCNAFRLYQFVCAFIIMRLRMMALMGNFKMSFKKHHG